MITRLRTLSPKEKTLIGYLKIAGIAIAAYAAVAVIQREVFEVPVAGKYLPR